MPDLNRVWSSSSVSASKLRELLCPLVAPRRESADAARTLAGSTSSRQPRNLRIYSTQKSTLGAPPRHHCTQQHPALRGSMPRPHHVGPTPAAPRRRAQTGRRAAASRAHTPILRRRCCLRRRRRATGRSTPSRPATQPASTRSRPADARQMCSHTAHDTRNSARSAALPRHQHVHGTRDSSMCTAPVTAAPKASPPPPTKRSPCTTLQEQFGMYVRQRCDTKSLA
eukprot:366057-Chlamydomonas_euryale.AAC.3